MGMSITMPPNHSFMTSRLGPTLLYARGKIVDRLFKIFSEFYWFVYLGHPLYSRPRQNSVFVGPQIIATPQAPRKTRSAFDIHSLVLDETAEQV